MKILNMYLLRVVLVGFLLSTVASAQNLLWWQNISEGKGAPIVKFDDNTPEIATSGSIIHSLWLTWTGFASGTHELNYRRSADNGITWGPKIKLIEDYFDAERGSRRMAVSGNYVHIIVNENFGAERQVIYFRSSDGGASFEPPKVLFNTQFGSQLINIDAEGSRVRISVEENKRLHMFKSDDNGSNFEKKLALGETFTATQYTSLKISGQNVFMICENQGRVHLLSSNDGGNTFNNKIISEPSKNGQHVTYPFINSNNSYCPKIAVDGNKIWIVWLGLDENDKLTVFVRHSPDGGVTLDTLKKVSGTITNISFGLETIAAKGNNVYVVFTSTNNLLYINQSMNGGTTYIGAKEFTRPNSYYLNSSFEPQLIIDPKDNGAYVIGSGIIIGKLLPDGTEKIPSFYGNYNFNSSREPKMVLSSGGYLHILQRAGIPGSDVNIWYRRINTNPIDPGNSDQVIKLNPVQSGDSARFDNMIIGPEISKKFSEAMTIEFWVKPSSLQNGEKKMLTQYRNGTGNLFNPLAFQLGATASNEPVAGLITSTGLYLLPAVKKLTADFWNHLAVSYKNDGSVNNFKVFINGQIAAQKTATGTITFSDALWILGSYGGVNTGPPGFIGSIDDLRFWNVGRSPDEIRINRFSKLQGNELGLVANYRFDVISPFGEVADISGNGHTGYLMYKEELKPSNIVDPKVSFTYIQSVKELYFTGKTVIQGVNKWDFGDNKTSDQLNPYYKYSSPGTFDVCFSVQGNEMIGTYCEKVEVKGIKDFSPKIAWNTGFFTIDVYGGGFKENSNLVLKHPDFGEIAALNLARDLQNGTITGVFDLHGAKIGNWQVVVRTGASDLVSSGLLKIETGQKINLDLNFVSSSAMLVNRWQTNILTISNKSPVDAVGVLLWVVYDDDPNLDLKFLNLKFTPHPEAVELGLENMLLGIDPFEVIDSMHGATGPQKVYPIYFPLIKANSTTDIQIRMVSKKAGKNFNLKAWINPPLYQSPINSSTLWCMANALIRYGTRVVLDITPFVPCIRLVPELAFENAVYKDFKPPTPQVGLFETRSFKYIAVTRILKCVFWSTSDIPKTLSGTRAIIAAITNLGESYQDLSDCYYGFEKLKFLDLKLFTLFSLDPNDKSGPIGYGTKNFIGNNQRVNYVVRFENTSTATAPAQEVFITDTLNNQMFDIKDFTFGPAGFGDTVITAIKGQYSFAHDVDLRPKKNIILRIEGQADTTKSIVNWKFTSLDPRFMELTEDPFGGFLPPNKVSPEGEGFVSFNVGLKNIPKNNDKISNRASIIFDLNKPILTNTYENTFDLVNPVSKVNINNPTTKDTVFTVNIAGSDTGSGIQSYDVYVSENFGEFLPYKEVFGNTFTFKGVIGKNYRFYSLAIDNAGNREAKKSSPDADVSITSSIQDNYILEKLIVYPSPSSFELFVEFYLPFEEFIDISMSDISGRELIRHDQIKCNSGLNVKNLDVTSLPDGFYNLSLKVGNRKVYKKVVVIK
jgi:hypothetical protein